MKLLVDADACPKSALQICIRMAQKYGVPLTTVASFNHRIESEHHVIVGPDPQETDFKIINSTMAGDVVVTQDWGLAAIVLGKGARSLSPAGREFRPGKIEFLLEEREVKARFRRGGGRTKGPRKRTPEDDRRFETCLERILSQQKAKTPLLK
jgi:uncharacterized protein YaiI (UPF0178 family)